MKLVEVSVGRQRPDAAGRRAGVDGVEGLLARVNALRGILVINLICGDGWVGVERDERDVANLRPGRQAGFGIDDEADVPHPPAGAILGWKEAGEYIGRQLRVRVDRLEYGAEDARGRIQADRDLDHERLAVLGHRHGGRVVLAIRRDDDVRVAEADTGQLERAPVEVRIERVGDHDPLRGGRGRRGVLEVDLVGEERARGDEVGWAVAGGAGEGVGILGIDRVDDRRTRLLARIPNVGNGRSKKQIAIISIGRLSGSGRRRGEQKSSAHDHDTCDKLRGDQWRIQNENCPDRHNPNKTRSSGDNCLAVFPDAAEDRRKGILRFRTVVESAESIRRGRIRDGISWWSSRRVWLRVRAGILSRSA